MTKKDQDLQELNLNHQLLISELRKRGYVEAEVVKLSATFFLSWQKTLSDNSEATSNKYRDAIEIFLDKLDTPR